MRKSQNVDRGEAAMMDIKNPALRRVQASLCAPCNTWGNGGAESDEEMGQTGIPYAPSPERADLAEEIVERALYLLDSKASDWKAGKITKAEFEAARQMVSQLGIPVECKGEKGKVKCFLYGEEVEFTCDTGDCE